MSKRIRIEYLIDSGLASVKSIGGVWYVIFLHAATDRRAGFLAG